MKKWDFAAHFKYIYEIYNVIPSAVRLPGRQYNLSGCRPRVLGSIGKKDRFLFVNKTYLLQIMPHSIKPICKVNWDGLIIINLAA